MGAPMRRTLGHGRGDPLPRAGLTAEGWRGPGLKSEGSENGF